VRDGVLDIHFFTDVNNAKVSAIVVKTQGQTQSPTLASEVMFAVNAGGPAYVGTDGTVYQADTGFSGGTTYTRAVAIAGTEDDVLYQSERYGNFAYAIPVPNGEYIVTLKFAEIYWTAPGKRVFDVEIEGLEVLPELDLVAQVGPATAYNATIPVIVTDGVLDIHFFTDVNNAKVSAIVVETQGHTPQAPAH
jgi:malectin (di-glucose binding ER protein)